MLNALGILTFIFTLLDRVLEAVSYKDYHTKANSQYHQPAGDRTIIPVYEGIHIY